MLGLQKNTAVKIR